MLDNNLIGCEVGATAAWYYYAYQWGGLVKKMHIGSTVSLRSLTITGSLIAVLPYLVLQTGKWMFGKEQEEEILKWKCTARIVVLGACFAGTYYFLTPLVAAQVILIHGAVQVASMAFELLFDREQVSSEAYVNPRREKCEV